jgi:hypothetical protein
MQIKSFRLDKLIPSDYKVTKQTNTVSNWIVDVKMGISPAPNERGLYEQVIEVSVTKNTLDKTVFLKVASIFGLAIEGKVTDQWNERNYQQYADLMQMSFCHARGIFAEVTKHELPNVGFFAIQDTGFYYNDLKTRYKQIWN